MKRKLTFRDLQETVIFNQLMAKHNGGPVPLSDIAEGFGMTVRNVELIIERAFRKIRTGKT